MPKGKALRNPNGYGSVVKLSGNRRKPFEVRVNTKIDDRGYPVYNVLGRYPTRQDAIIQLAKYNENPYDIAKLSLTFKNVYEMYYDQKYIKSPKKLSDSSRRCTIASFNKCEQLHNAKFADIRPQHMQSLLDSLDYSHATLEHVKNLFRQMYALAMEYDLVQKDWSAYLKINKEDDDEHGIPFTGEELSLLWKSKDKPWVDSVLIYIYSGWRLTELLEMPISNINMTDETFFGGKKTKSSKNRTVPIHSSILPFVKNYLRNNPKYIFSKKDTPMSISAYRKRFDSALKEAGITNYHTPHDCRHTFATMLNNAGANPVAVKRMLGHSTSGDITIDVYTHKDLPQLKEAIELIKTPK